MMKAGRRPGDPRTELPMLRQLVAQLTKKPPFPAGGSFRRYEGAVPGSDGKKPQSTCFYHDENILIVSDAFPKARCHCLVLAKDPAISSLGALHKGHLPLLQHMHIKACEYAEFLRSTQFPKLRFISGFHALPSLPPLHMHLISMDLDSDRLKNKKHYNSFSTNFFLPTPLVVEDVTRNGKVTLNHNEAEFEALEAAPLRCLWCGALQDNIPAVKTHIKQCPKNASMDP